MKNNGFFFISLNRRKLNQKLNTGQCDYNSMLIYGHKNLSYFDMF